MMCKRPKLQEQLQFMRPYFTDKDKERSVRIRRYFLREWFNSHGWLAYNRKESKAFCSTCATHADTQTDVFGNNE